LQSGSSESANKHLASISTFGSESLKKCFGIYNPEYGAIFQTMKYGGTCSSIIFLVIGWGSTFTLDIRLALESCTTGYPLNIYSIFYGVVAYCFSFFMEVFSQSVSLKVGV